MSTCPQQQHDSAQCGTAGLVVGRVSPSSNTGMNRQGHPRMVLLHQEFQPGPSDFILGKGRAVYYHEGNTRFRVLVDSRLDEYRRASTRGAKSQILAEVVAQVRREAPISGGFVKKCEGDGRWYRVNDFLARERASQAFRDALHGSYKSSSAAKTQSRRMRKLRQARMRQERQSALARPVSSNCLSAQVGTYAKEEAPSERFDRSDYQSRSLASVRPQITVASPVPSFPRIISWPAMVTGLDLSDLNAESKLAPAVFHGGPSSETLGLCDEIPVMESMRNLEEPFAPPAQDLDSVLLLCADTPTQDGFFNVKHDDDGDTFEKLLQFVQSQQTTSTTKPCGGDHPFEPMAVELPHER